MVKALVVDIGTTSLRSAIVDAAGVVSHVTQRPLTISAPAPGELIMDPSEIATLTLECARATLAAGGPVDAVGIANQRQTTLLFDGATGVPAGPALGWQDLRTVFDCLILQGQGLRFAPNQLATKAQWLLANHGAGLTSPRIASLETWLAWQLSKGTVFVSDHSNMGLSGLVLPDLSGYDATVLDTLGLSPEVLPTLVPTMGLVGSALALDGAPPITALVGDQQASLFGQCCTEVGQTKLTLGTGAMLNQRTGSQGPEAMNRFDSGCFPVPVASTTSQVEWGIEAIALSAGTCIEWLRELGLIEQPRDTEALARSVESSDGVYFVPALVGLGTPQWDFGARGAFFGLTRGSGRAHMVRAVLEGIAHNAADLVDAAIAQTGVRPDSLRLDGGMSANSFLVETLANATGLRIEVSGEIEATTRGAGLMALEAIGAISRHDVAQLWSPRHVVEPSWTAEMREAQRATWASMVARAERTIPDLSSVSF